MRDDDGMDGAHGKDDAVIEQGLALGDLLAATAMAVSPNTSIVAAGQLVATLFVSMRRQGGAENADKLLHSLLAIAATLINRQEKVGVAIGFKRHPEGVSLEGDGEEDAG